MPIESEEKKQRLLDIIERWVSHTKVEPYLREGDIPGLVRQIIEEFYHVSLSCGHYVRDLDEGVSLAFKDNDDSEIHGIYCKDCAKRYKKELGAWET